MLHFEYVCATIYSKVNESKGRLEFAKVGNSSFSNYDASRRSTD
jgi:hypothetical protein